MRGGGHGIEIAHLQCHETRDVYVLSTYQSDCLLSCKGLVAILMITSNHM